MNNRCDSCNLYGCRHQRKRHLGMLERSDTLPLGQRVGENIMEEQRTPTIPMGPMEESIRSRILIPPPPIVPNVGTSISINRELQKVNIQKDWVNCNICNGKVYIPYLDAHLKVHTEKFEPSTSIVKASSITSISSPTTSESFSSSSSKSSNSKPTLNKQEPYKFRHLEQVCFASSVSQNNRYSDFTIIFWEKDRVNVHSSVYAGGNTSTTIKEWERFSIHIVYDSREDYYTVSSKLLKRSGYSTWDTEDTIPDRICLQNELFGEIKRALLFFRISPKAAYKHFRKAMSSEFVIEQDDKGKAFICQTKNCKDLSDKLKVSSTYQGYHGEWS
jgi:hypothetical protein